MTYYGQLDPFWTHVQYSQYTREYVKQPIMAEEVERWRALGYTHESFTGEVCIIKKPYIDVFWPTVDKLQLKLRQQMLDVGMSLFVMKNGDIMPEHVDHFNTYTKMTGADRKTIKRCLVMLEQWKPGHYLEIAGEHHLGWAAGSFYCWDADTPHAAANIGVEPRYTLQITFHG